MVFIERIITFSCVSLDFYCQNKPNGVINVSIIIVFYNYMLCVDIDLTYYML